VIGLLIVDDHELVRAGMRSRLEREVDISVLGEAATAEDALATTCALHPDVVLLDLLLPRKSGYDLIPELVRHACWWSPLRPRRAGCDARC
jgi:DNA-binding NarL/FixJ family response regulator